MSDENTNGSEEIVETQEVETPEVEDTQTEVSEDHPTKLGRKVKTLSEDFSTIKSAIEEMKQMLASNKQVDPSQFQYEQPKNPLDTLDDDDFLTAKDVKRILKEQKDFEENTSKQYRNTYATELSKVAQRRGIDVDEYKAIEKELLDNYYGVETTGNAAIDAKAQFAMAEASYLRKQSAKLGKSPLKGGSEHPPLGVGGAETRTSNASTGIKIDAELAQLMKEIGKDPNNADDVKWANDKLSKK